MPAIKSETKPKREPTVTLADRLENGSLTVSEVLDLGRISRARFYDDVKAGRVAIFKIGRASRVPGPSAKAYLRGAAA